LKRRLRIGRRFFFALTVCYFPKQAASTAVHSIPRMVANKRQSCLTTSTAAARSKPVDGLVIKLAERTP